MVAPTFQDVERLLAPITTAAPAGASLRFEGTYDRIRQARREDDPSLPPGPWERPLKVADLPTVASLCSEALESRTKDLQIAGWLADAWASLHGLLGIQRGIELLTQLADKYWDTAYPLPDEDGHEARGQIIDWLDESLWSRLRTTRISEPGAAQPLTIGELSTNQRKVGEPAGGQEGLMARVSLVDPNILQRVLLSTETVLTAADAFAHAVTQRIAESGGLRRLGAELRVLALLLREALRGMPQLESQTNLPYPTASSNQLETAASTQSGTSAPHTIASRADAYRRLNEAADYLLRTEPHSPVPYLVKRAISWGNLSLAELLHEFIPDSNDLVAAHRLLGMRQRED